MTPEAASLIASLGNSVTDLIFMLGVLALLGWLGWLNHKSQ